MAGMTIVGSTSYGALKNHPPRFKFYESGPVFKDWPRDCSLIYGCTVSLNYAALKKCGGRNSLIAWLDKSTPTWELYIEMIDLFEFGLKNQDDAMLFKMTWM